MRRVRRILSSVNLAIALLTVILACCVAGVTIVRGERAWALIFSTLWFNSLLVLLVVNVAFCFFGSIGRKRVTLASLGMILFHLSFVAILAGVVFNSLFYFRGMIRLTEGEVLPSDDPVSYDYSDRGRFFNFSKFTGSTTLVKVHRGYEVDGKDKQVAYEIAVGEGSLKRQGIIYTTRNLDHNGFAYFREKEGYSLLVILYDNRGNEIYGAHVPLQSLKGKGDSYFYTTGTKDAQGSLPFPQDPLEPQFLLQAVFHPSFQEGRDRDGEAQFQLRPLHGKGAESDAKPLAAGKAPIGARVRVGDYYFSAKEVRYWVGMNVRYEPGKTIVLSSLLMGLGGLLLTFIGRMLRKSAGQ